MIKNISVLLIIVFFGILVRMINLNQPFLEGASTRQIETAMIARNFYEHGFRLFYPQVDWFGDNHGYLMQEFYIIPFIAAVFYKLLGGAHEWILRFISVVSYVPAAVMLYKLAAYYHSKKAALIAVLAFSFSPLSVYLGRAVHPEMTMIFFNISAVYFFSRYIYEEKFNCGILAALSFVFAVLLKAPNLYLLLPLAFVAYAKYGWAFLKELKLWVLLFACSIPIAVFNYHQHLVRIAFPNPDMVNFKMDVILDSIRVYLARKDFYKAVFDNLVTYTLTPIGFTLLTAGLIVKVKDRRDLLFHAWLLSAGIFFVLMPGQSWQGYYQMHLLPAACIIIGKLIAEFSGSEFYKRGFLLKPRLLGVVFLMVVFFAAFRYSYAYYSVPANFRYVVETGREVDKFAAKDALIIASIENGSDLIYYSHRRGWPFAVNLEEKKESDIASGEDITGRIYDSIEYLEYLRGRGARYFASASTREFFSNEKFAAYMLGNYKVLERTRDFIIFDLTEKLKVQIH